MNLTEEEIKWLNQFDDVIAYMAFELDDAIKIDRVNELTDYLVHCAETFKLRYGFTKDGKQVVFLKDALLRVFRRLKAGEPIFEVVYAVGNRSC